uniref:Uncharacterized protein n=1 Tax=Rhizophagus irregularis (strain DAOM 181602 / DAOM 197198 / MUCL 43194) TaxID=747089 RepID=U9UN64_RHIID
MVYASYYSKGMLLISDFIRKFLTKLKEISQFLPQVPSKYEERRGINYFDYMEAVQFYGRTLGDIINLTGTSKAIYAINSSNLRSGKIDRTNLKSNKSNRTVEIENE